MLCGSCNKREATIHITQNVNGHSTRIDLCPVCAKEQGYLADTAETLAQFFKGDPLGGGLSLFQIGGGASGLGGPAAAGERCAYCGTSFEEFRARGLLGCTHCYEEFEGRLLPVVRRIQAGEVHTGRRPDRAPKEAPEAPPPARPPFLRRPVRIPRKKPVEAAPPKESEVERLRREQAEAVKAEDYEKAARLRDRIRTLEEKEKGGGAR